MDIKNEENPGEEKNPFKIKAPFEGPVKMPFPVPEAMKNSPFMKGKLKFVAIGVILLMALFGLKMVSRLFKSTKPSLGDTMKQQ